MLSMKTSFELTLYNFFIIGKKVLQNFVKIPKNDLFDLQRGQIFFFIAAFWQKKIAASVRFSEWLAVQ